MGSITVFCLLSLIVASINSLPIKLTRELPDIVIPETVEPSENVTVNSKSSEAVVRNTIRPGMVVTSYHVQLTPNVAAGTFDGRVLIVVNVNQATREDELVFNIEDLDVSAVRVALLVSDQFNDANFNVDDGLLTIDTGRIASMYSIVVEYSGNMNTLDGFFLGGFADSTSYVAMNLHPTNARRVFPCIDEPTEAPTITFTIDGSNFNNIVANSLPEDNTQTQFRPMGGPAHVWGAIAHSFVNVNNPVTNVPLFGRQGVTGQDLQVSVAINSVFTTLNTWTEKDYFNIVEGVQDGRMNIFALPDVDMDWNSLSIVGIWEPYIYMEVQHAVSQRKQSFVNIAEAISRQWFGYVLFPENWIYQWVITGMGSYAAYDALRNFQTNINNPDDDSLLDMNTIFVTDVIQESLLHDAYSSATTLQQEDWIFDEGAIRAHVNGLVKHKAPALMYMLKTVLGGGSDTDYIHEAAKSLFLSRSLQSVTTLNFIDAVNSRYASHDNPLVDDLEEYLEPYTLNNGYALLHVDLSPRGVILTQERFGFSTSRPTVTYDIPITYTTAVNPNFDDLTPVRIMGAALISLDFVLDEEQWVVFNLQGQGYYRVNYGADLWERIIEALQDPDERQRIHPLNRATLVDDALNLARGGRLDYDIAFRVVLTMEHETEYAVWKAFIRNMNFLRKRLVATVTEDEDLDPDIYLRMVRRSIVAFENEVGFTPEWNVIEPAMTSLARGLVMDHACRSNYDPCIAAAVDWFYDPNTADPTVNPNIPHDLRPAVYCAMARTGDDDVMAALQDRLDIVSTMYERVVILESMGCNQDEVFINGYLAETIAENSPYSIEERNKIFLAIAESSFENAGRALRFLVSQTNAIRANYGGEVKLEAIIYAMIENMADEDLSDVFARWVDSNNSNLDDAIGAAEQAVEIINENLSWNRNLFEQVYEWIDENDANVATMSMFLVCLTFMVTIFNH